jgi:hypothetical protein
MRFVQYLIFLSKNDIIDLTVRKVSRNRRTASDSDVEMVGPPSNSSHIEPRAPICERKGKEKEKEVQINVPTDTVVTTWRKGGDDMEPSTKMLALVDLLQEWEGTGDKTICYSQCKSFTVVTVSIFDRLY